MLIGSPTVANFGVMQVRRTLSSFIIQSAELRRPSAFIVGGRDLLRDGDSIVYRAGQHSSMADNTLFFGPYIELGSGIYLFTFNGQLDGALSVDFAHECGHVVKAAMIETFAKPLCIAAARPFKDFEVRGHKTPFLRKLSLDSISVSLVFRPPVVRDQTGLR